VLQSATLRREAEIKVEAYDHALLKYVTVRYGDVGFPTHWAAKRVLSTPSGGVELVDGAPATPGQAVVQAVPVIYVLLHPEQWTSGASAHCKEDLKRLKEALAYRFGLGSGRARVKSQVA
jgi:hypothetical protein